MNLNFYYFLDMNQLVSFMNYLKNLFPYIKRDNKEKFSTSGSRNQRTSKQQINAILNWFNKELLHKFIKNSKNRHSRKHRSGNRKPKLKN